MYYILVVLMIFSNGDARVKSEVFKSPEQCETARLNTASAIKANMFRFVDLEIVMDKCEVISNPLTEYHA